MAELLVAVLVFAVLAAAYLRGLTRYLINDDEGSYLYAAWRISQGELPYLDFLTPQLPLFLFPGGLAMRLAGPSVEPARVLAALATLAAGGVFWLLLRRLFRGAVAAIATVALLLQPDVFLDLRTYRSDPFMLLFGLAGLWVFTLAVVPRPGAVDPPSRRRLAASGVLFGLGTLTKLFAPFIMAGCAAWLVADAAARGRRLWPVATDLAVMGASAAATVALGFGVFLAAGAEVYEAVLGHHLAQGSGLPVSAVAGKAIVFLRDYVRHHALVVLVALAAAVAAWRAGRREEALLAWQLPTLGAFFLMSRELYGRHLVYLVPAMAGLFALAVVRMWPGRVGSGPQPATGDVRHATSDAFPRLMACAVVGALLLPWALLDRDLWWRTEDGTRRVADIIALVTRPDEIVLSDYSELNFYARRATTYSGASLSAGAAQSGQITWGRIAAELEGAGSLPPLVLVDRTTVDGQTYGHLNFLRDREDFEAWLEGEYEPAGVVVRRLGLPDRQLHNLYTLRGRPLPTLARFAGGPRLIAAGWAAEASAPAHDSTLALASAWDLAEPATTHLAVTTRLVDRAGRTWWQADGPLDAADGRAAPSWLEGEVTAVRAQPWLAPGLPGGIYDAWLGVYARPSASPLAVSERADGATGDLVRAAEVRVPPWQPSPLALREALEGSIAVEGTADGLTLLARGRLPDGPVDAGSVFPVETWWRVDRPGDATLRYTLGDRLVGTVAADIQVPLAPAGEDASSWPPGTVVRNRVDVPVMATSAGGAATLAVAGAGSGGPLILGEVQVRARDLSDVATLAPPMAVELNAVVGGVAEVLGFDVEPGLGVAVAPGERFAVSLVWRAATTIAVSYKVTVQVLGPDGAPVTQHDGEPADWSRPTTTWVPGEVIVDRHEVLVPDGLAAGEYRVVAAMYDAGTGRRLVVSGPDGDGDMVGLFIVEVGPPR